MESQRNKLSLQVSNYLPESFDHLNLHLVNHEEVGKNISSVLHSCANHFYIDGLKRKSHLKGKDEKLYETCQFLTDYTWEQLNTGNWKDVNISWRYLYSYAALFQVLNELADRERNLQKICRTCDMGLLMGAPILNNILSKIASCIAKEISRSSPPIVEESKTNFKRQCIQKDILPENAVPVEVCPSLEYFCREYYQTQKPVLIQRALEDWPAFTNKQWSVEYILQVAGCRTVPVEIGSKYTDDTWSQKIMTLQEFAENFISTQSPEGVGYCAQHQLLDQIEELADDIQTPLYCCMGDEEPDVNCWFGPAGTVSPLHFDPKDNCLTQVFGEKYICLYPPEATAMLYPHDSHLLDNTSQVDLENPDLEKFPMFENAPRAECILRAGELLFVPKKWWHFVRSLETSFSISFWWK